MSNDNRVAITVFSNRCGQCVNLQLRKRLDEDVKHRYSQVLSRVDGVEGYPGTVMYGYNLDFSIARSFSMDEVVPEALCAIAAVYGIPIDKIDFVEVGSAVGQLDYRPFVEAAKRLAHEQNLAAMQTGIKALDAVITFMQEELRSVRRTRKNLSARLARAVTRKQN